MTVPGLLILIGSYLMGAVISLWWLPEIPGAVIGILLLVAVLSLLGRIPDYLSRTSATLLQYLPLILAVPALGIVSADKLPPPQWLGLIAAITLSLLITVPFCGWLLQRLIQRRKSK
ncbi:CidA/LrgA family protein [Pseudomonas matsuisoli]|uniref:CidA/LrgA family protein n=1 Tax=Pseudomonas matsuisoli TaxID=1515666 RepID=A0A917UR53_9PSED|nr:CidA/LrgA family protein [Pseudomonas matsuisoli]GGJ78066.1 hypothetical protein GCM10009304_00030 [Pseudomonas matsuisoli]